jgi:glycerophosphoryl diester phosphodiesterase
MLDKTTFFRPIAHRGLHNAPEGIIENTAPAFEAAIRHGYGIECDLQPLADGTPMVFHDFTLDRLIDAKGPINALGRTEVKKLHYRGQDTGIIAFADFLDLVAGRVPLLVEIKSDWQPAQPEFLKGIAALVADYQGPLALMSFDPVVMARMRELAPMVPRGIVSGIYQGEGWYLDQLSAERAYRLTHLLECGPVQPSFISYHVKALPTPVTRFLREGLEMPLFCWTVRTLAERKIAAEWSDAPTFEGYLP